MSNTIEVISDKIDICKNLLGIFLDERQLFLEKEKFSINEILHLITKKANLVERLQDVKKSLCGSANSSSSDNSLEPSIKRQMMRELSALLEQLLVIEHENEILLKQSIENVSTIGRQHYKTSHNNLNIATKAALIGESGER